MSFLSRMRWRKNSAGTIFTRSRANLIEGSGVTLTFADDPTDDELDITIAASGGGGGGGDGGGGWSLIEEQILAMDAASVSFSSIPQTFDDLILVAYGRTDRAAAVGDDFLIRVGNGSADSGTNYRLAGRRDGQNADNRTTTSDQTAFHSDQDGAVTGDIFAAASADAGLRGFLQAIFWDYRDVSERRVMTYRGGRAGTSSNVTHSSGQGQWLNVADAIDIVTIAPRYGTNFLTDSFFRLYGRRRVAEAWTTYTPDWTAVTANPDIGNGTLQGAYRQDGKTLHLRIRLVAGSTTTFGSGAWSFGLPSGIVAKTGTAQYLEATAQDTGVARRLGAGRLVSAATTIDELIVSAGGAWDSATPHAWANTDELTISGTIEVD